MRTPYQNARRLIEAAGYLELGMPEHALNLMETISEAGELEGARQYLTGEALRAQARYGEAVEPLATAAALFPAPFDRRIWLALSECYKLTGRNDLALDSLGFARGAHAPPPQDEEN